MAMSLENIATNSISEESYPQNNEQISAKSHAYEGPHFIKFAHVHVYCSPFLPLAFSTKIGRHLHTVSCSNFSRSEEIYLQNKDKIGQNLSLP